jgi:hypothetical protein
MAKRRATNSNKQNPSKRRRFNPREIPASTLTYAGPVRSFSEIQEANLTSIVMSSTDTLVSDSGGIINLIVGNSPAGCPGWGSAALLYDEYRVLAFEVYFVPHNKYTKVTTVTTGLVGVIDRDNLTALGSYSVAVQKSSLKVLDLEGKWKMTERLMGSTEEAQFLNTAAPASNAWIKLYSDGLTVSTTYGRYFVTYRVQFRGKGQ